MESLTVYKRNLGSSKSHGPWVITPIWVSGGNKEVAAWEFLFHVNSHLARLYRIYKQEPFPTPCLPVAFSPGSPPPLLAACSKGAGCGADVLQIMGAVGWE